MWIQSLFEFLQMLLSAYIFIISLRIILGWFPSAQYNKAYDLITKITDPYLDLFKGIHGLRRGAFDFTPIAAIMLLVLVRDILWQFSVLPAFSFGIIVLVTVNVLWNTINWILILFLIITFVRLISIFFHANPTALLWGNLDLMLQPLILFIMKFHSRKAAYQNLLILACLFLGVLLVTGNLFLVPGLTNLVRLIPF